MLTTRKFCENYVTLQTASQELELPTCILHISWVKLWKKDYH